MSLVFNPNSLNKFPSVLKKKKEKKKNPEDLLFPTLTVIAIQPESLHFLGLFAQLELQGGKAIMPVSKKKTSLDTKNQEKPSHLKGCQRHQDLIYNAKVKRLTGRQNPRGN